MTTNDPAKPNPLDVNYLPPRLRNLHIIGYLIVSDKHQLELPKLIKHACKRDNCSSDLALFNYPDGAEYTCLACGRNYPVVTTHEINQPAYRKYREANNLVFFEELRSLTPCQ